MFLGRNTEHILYMLPLVIKGNLAAHLRLHKSDDALVWAHSVIGEDPRDAPRHRNPCSVRLSHWRALATKQMQGTKWAVAELSESLKENSRKVVAQWMKSWKTCNPFGG